MQPALLNRLRSLPSKLWVAGASIVTLLGGVIAERVANYFVPVGDEANAFGRALRWFADVMAGLPDQYLIIFALGAVTPIVWDWAAGHFRVFWGMSQDASKPEPVRVEPKPISLESRLYVGDMGVDANKLQSEGVIEIWGRFFNATGHSLWLHRLKGAIVCATVSGSHRTTLGPFPPALILAERCKTENLEDATEIFFVIEQRVPEPFAKAILGVTDEQAVQLLFENFEIILASYEAPTLQLKLPTWGGIRLYRRPDCIQAARVFTLKVDVILANVQTEIDGGTF